MGDKTKIQWTEATWNPIRGCSRVSPGCQNCYAETMAARFCGPGQPYHGLAERIDGRSRWTGNVMMIANKLAQPLLWRRPRMIFVNSMSDLFHENLTNHEIAAVFGVMAASPHHTFQVLTKRADRMVEWFRWIKEQADPHREVEYGGEWTECHAHALMFEVDNHPDGDGGPTHCKSMGAPGRPWPLPNVWLGVSAEDQKTWNKRVPRLMECPAKVRWVSIEPLLSGVNVRDMLCVPDNRDPMLRNDPHAMFLLREGMMSGNADGPRSLDWIVLGGESGQGARPCGPGWIRDILAQCREARVPAFVKQLGSNVPFHTLHSKGGDIDEWPEDLQVREWPACVAA